MNTQHVFPFAAFKIHITAATKEALDRAGGFIMKLRGEMEIRVHFNKDSVGRLARGARSEKRVMSDGGGGSHEGRIRNRGMQEEPIDVNLGRRMRAQGSITTPLISRFGQSLDR